MDDLDTERFLFGTGRAAGEAGGRRKARDSWIVVIREGTSDEILHFKEIGFGPLHEGRKLVIVIRPKKCGTETEPKEVNMETPTVIYLLTGIEAAPAGGGPTTAVAVSNQLIENAGQTMGGSDADQRAVAEILGVSATDVERVVEMALRLRESNAPFWDHIRGMCMASYRVAQRTHETAQTELDRKLEQVQSCMCNAIADVRQENQGDFPNDAFKALSDQFGCDR